MSQANKATSPQKKTRSELSPAPFDAKYIINVKTGNVGTESNVFVIIYGTKCDTDKIYLKNSSKIGVQSKVFDRFKSDEFTIYDKDVGNVILRIGILTSLTGLFLRY
jgi:hypothetical protein